MGWWLLAAGVAAAIPGTHEAGFVGVVLGPPITLWLLYRKRNYGAAVTLLLQVPAWIYSGWDPARDKYIEGHLVAASLTAATGLFLFAASWWAPPARPRTRTGSG